MVLRARLRVERALVPIARDVERVRSGSQGKIAGWRRWLIQRLTCQIAQKAADFVDKKFFPDHEYLIRQSTSTG